LVPGTVKDVEDVGSATGTSVVDKVISRGETKKPTPQALTAARVFAEQPKSFCDPVYYFFCDFKTDACGPVNENLVEVPVGSL
jgi:hypothetical protein